MKRNVLPALFLLLIMLLPVSAFGAPPAKGDVDNSGGIALPDAILSLRVVAGMNPTGIRENYPASGADVNGDGDGKIGMAEAIYILQTLAELRPAASTTIDAHAHAWTSDSRASVQQLFDLMTANGISQTILMQPPMPGYRDTETGADSSESLRNFFAGLGSAFPCLYGGAELQPLLYATGHAGAITLAELYPNGGAGLSQADVDTLNAIAADTTKTYSRIFKSRATAAAQSGKYRGFGELAPLHYSQRAGHPFMTYKVDTEGMLWLSDLAAQYNMVLDVHMEVEATGTKLAELSTLLTYNPNTRIIWDHAGWSSSGLATAAVFSQMLADHPNLYLSLKMRGNSNLGAGSPTDGSGNLKGEWRTLLTTYADRIMVGTDAKYWENSGTILAEDLAGAYTLLDNMLKLLPADRAQKIRSGTARTLFN